MERMRLVELNYEASKFCLSKSAFVQASEFLRRGLALLDSNSMWTEHQDLAMEITVSLARMQLIIGDFSDCIELLCQALLHSESVESKVQCLLICIECRMAANEVSQVIKTGTTAVRLCGVKMPDHVSPRHVVFKLLRVRRLMRGTKDTDIIALPLMEDKLIPSAVEILSHMCGICLFRDDENRAVYSALLATELTLKYGLSPYSASAIGIYGIAEASLGHIQRGYWLGKLSMELQNHLKTKDSECATISTAVSMLLHWKEPLRDLRGTLDACLDSAYEKGDNVHGVYCAFTLGCMEYSLGVRLNRIEAEMRFNYSRFSSLSKDNGFTLFLQPILQFVLNIQEKGRKEWASLCDLTGEIMNEHDFMTHATREKNVTFEMAAYAYKAALAYHFGGYSLAESLYEKMTRIAPGYWLSLNAVALYLVGGLTYFQRYRCVRRRKLLRRARWYSKQLRWIESIGLNPNVTACVTFLAAVKASMHKSASPTLLSAKFDEAIQQLESKKLVHFEAMANETAAFVFAHLELLEEAERYLERSMELYRYSWGATAKYEWLKSKSDKILTHVRAQRRIDVNSRLLGIAELKSEEE